MRKTIRGALVLILLLAGCGPGPQAPGPVRRGTERDGLAVAPFLVQADDAGGASVHVSWDSLALRIELRDVRRLLKSVGRYTVLVGLRAAEPLSGPETPPPVGRDGPAASFRWRLLSSNPLPGDGLGFNPPTVHAFVLGPNGNEDATEVRVWQGAAGTNGWRETASYQAAEVLAKPADINLSLPWAYVGSAARAPGPDEFLDLIVLVCDRASGDIELSFPAQNGAGANILLSYVHSLSVGRDGDIAVTNTAETDGTRVLLADRFETLGPGWQSVGPDGPGGEGTHGVTDGKLTLHLNAEGLSGMIHTTQVSGSFDVQLDLALLEGDACGLRLYKTDGGRPDWDSYLAVERARSTNGAKVVRAYAVRDGQTMAREWWDTFHPYFEYELGTEEFGDEALAVRILKDERSGCLRFYYKYRREVDGIPLEGWMEFPTVADWDARPVVAAPYVRGDGRRRTAAAFDRVLAKQVRRDDVRDGGEEFAVTRRPYTFSGVEGDAVVVTFGREFPFARDAKFVFWSEASYIPWWHIDDRCAVSYEFCEIWGGGTTWKGGGPGGCCEPMSDRLLRWSNVDVVEAGRARAIVRWQYVLANPEYQWWGRHPAKRPVAEEWYCFYPDGTGVRKLTYYPVTDSGHELSWNEISEPMLIQRGGVLPGECLSRTALSMLSLEADTRNYTYLRETPMLIENDVRYWRETIARVNLNRRPAVFEVFAQGEKTFRQTFPMPYTEWWGHYQNDWHSQRKGGYEYEGDFWPFAHWPISRIPYEDDTKRNGRYLREPGHTSVLSVPGHLHASEPTTWAMLIGLAQPGDDEDLKRRTSSWLYPGDVEVRGGGCEFVENDYYTRSLVFRKTGEGACRFVITPTPLVVNPVVTIQGWGDRPLEVRVNDERVPAGRYRFDLVDGAAVIWLAAAWDQETLVSIEPAR